MSRSFPTVVHVASEVRPFSQTGGLADVLATLPPAIAALGATCHVVSPLYRDARSEDLPGTTMNGALSLPMGRVDWTAVGTENNGVHWWLVDLPWLFDRPGFYVDPHGRPYPDDALRFGVFGIVAAELAFRLGADVVHGHDWQSAGALAHCRGRGSRRPGTALTIHNLAFQGRSPLCWAEPMGWGARLDDVEFYGELNFMKLAIRSADRVTTVSPSYAAEIVSGPAGEGLRDVLVHDAASPVIGIVNGLGSRLREVLPSDRVYNREKLAERLPGISAESVVIGMVGRWTVQKGIDLALHAMHEALNTDGSLCCVLLGSGDPDAMAAARELRAKFPGRVMYEERWDESLAEWIFGGADIFLMPSRFEPCGLAQLRAMRQGTLPVVTPVGGLNDTVRDAAKPGGYGFVASDVTKDGVAAALRRAISAYAEQQTWQSMMQCAMTRDLYEWDAAARRYIGLYDHLLSTRTTDDDE